MHVKRNDLNAKSRMKGDFHVRFRERLRVKFPWSTRHCVVSTFGSGCSAVVTQATIENRKGGKRTFLGFFDPSVRPHFEADKLSYTIPMSRFKEMYETMRQSCLFDTHAWGKIKERMNG